jgi:hypothetical protein
MPVPAFSSSREPPLASDDETTPLAIVQGLVSGDAELEFEHRVILGDAATPR